MVLCARPSDASAELFQRCHLVCTKQCSCRQSGIISLLSSPALEHQTNKWVSLWSGMSFNLKIMSVLVWSSLGVGDVPSDLRLGPNILCRVALDDTFLGCSKCSRWFGGGHVGSSTNLMSAPPPLPLHLFHRSLLFGTPLGQWLMYVCTLLMELFRLRERLI